jgi:hypothetical protein
MNSLINFECRMIVAHIPINSKAFQLYQSEAKLLENDAKFP